MLGCRFGDTVMLMVMCSFVSTAMVMILIRNIMATVTAMMAMYSFVVTTMVVRQKVLSLCHMLA